MGKISGLILKPSQKPMGLGKSKALVGVTIVLLNDHAVKLPFKCLVYICGFELFPTLARKSCFLQWVIVYSETHKVKVPIISNCKCWALNASFMSNSPHLKLREDFGWRKQECKRWGMGKILKCWLLDMTWQLHTTYSSYGYPVRHTYRIFSMDEWRVPRCPTPIWGEIDR